MTDPVKPRRYDNTSRRSHSDETRRRILGVAHQAMVERGYQATNIADVAAAVGVHIDTVYRLIGPKPVLLRELIERAISGRDAAVRPEDRDYVKAIRTEADPARKLAIYAAAMYDIQGRLAPLLLALRDAATTAPEAKQVWQEISDRRATNMRLLVEDLAGAGGLRPGLSTNDAADIIWVTNSAEVYLQFTRERRWPPERYRQWLEETWCRLLLPDPPLHGGSSNPEAQRTSPSGRDLPGLEGRSAAQLDRDDDGPDP
ncbi:MAG TPA: TetR/AcrR family transcriptional regulator [Acidimicrobiales bacterium]|nr:TetR/AcrR family transcriptional regulator [Acidimicrobiales bacterium]